MSDWLSEWMNEYTKEWTIDTFSCDGAMYEYVIDLLINEQNKT